MKALTDSVEGLATVLAKLQANINDNNLKIQNLENNFNTLNHKIDLISAGKSVHDNHFQNITERLNKLESLLRDDLQFIKSKLHDF